MENVECIERYWICSDCAQDKGWEFPEWPVTCVTGFCGWCSRTDKTTLIPTCDFKRPGHEQVWD